ncbi:AMMECR1 domain-containing protein [Vulcanisaeta distributa]|uniref:AMMECR1 domain protein n=1 Tax=Vulcanisaeta distributa (strain DSM 14429 / JCM 11212 / NBRC 100878 / IC-017) TaxID=572478 RepID=E1QPA3_VULDI|nr:AMMECR1 domain-containing protein [Vulcanisaeta distributa]ADN50274.1 AMMECR1 domain protein [Vulcanisaeta distributa DSM 14429]
MELFRPLNEQEYTSLIRYLRAKILERLGIKADYEIDPTHLVRIAELKFGVFVSIEKLMYSDGMIKRVLRGSMGTIRPIKNLLEDSVTATMHAAFYDPRFSPISIAEFKNCVLEVTVISPLIDVDMDWVRKEMVLGYHGLYMVDSGKATILLPQKVVEMAENYYQKTNKQLGVDELIRELCDSLKICNPTSIKAFRTQIIYELRPDGNVIERKLYLNRLLNNKVKQQAIVSGR